MLPILARLLPWLRVGLLVGVLVAVAYFGYSYGKSGAEATLATERNAMLRKALQVEQEHKLQFEKVTAELADIRSSHEKEKQKLAVQYKRNLDAVRAAGLWVTTEPPANSAGEVATTSDPSGESKSRLSGETSEALITLTADADALVLRYNICIDERDTILRYYTKGN